METDWLGELLPTSVMPESRSKVVTGSHSSDSNGHTTISRSSIAPRPIPPSSSQQPHNWDLADLLNPSAAVTHVPAMSLDFSSTPSQSLYPQPDPYHLHNSSDSHNSSSSHHQLPSSVPSHPFDHSNDSLDSSDHSGYDLFPNSTSPPSFSSHRYRTNASSSTSIGHGYAMNTEGLYSHSSFSDSAPSFAGSNNNPYDIIHSLPSSYGSGKISPLTPSDPVGGLHTQTNFPHSKDFSSQNYPELPDRRLPNIQSGGYQPDIMEDYSMGGINNSLPFPPALQHFPDRIGRFPEGRYSHTGPTTTVPSHVPSNHGSDLRGIAPHATHVPGYEDMPHFMSANSHQEMSLRMPTVDETLARKKLQGHPIMGASGDLQTFIRYFRYSLYMS